MQRRLRKVRWRDGFLPNDNLDLARASGSFRFDPRLASPKPTLKKDQQAPLGPGILHRDSQEFLDQLGKNHLTRNRLRCFRYSFNVQLPGRRPNRG